MTNMVLAESILQRLWTLGSREVVVCAGARNAPFVSLLSQPSPWVVHPFFEERSAAFFALGRSLCTRRPVVVITTSGTAAAELLPAAIEAHYQGVPLILVTADRPRRYRGSGAPQAIEQWGLFSHYVNPCHDIEGDFPLEAIQIMARPAHLNVCFDEPLIDAACKAWTPLPNDDPPPVSRLHSNSSKFEWPGRRPLVLVGGLPLDWRSPVRERLKDWGRPVYLEGPSGLRGHPDLSGIEVCGGEGSLRSFDYDSVIRLGSVPTLRLWRDLENNDLPVLNFSLTPFSGLPRTKSAWNLQTLMDAPPPSFQKWSATERALDQERAMKLEGLMREFPWSEPATVRWVSEQLPPAARLFVGNSLPIREWDLAAVRHRPVDVFANRGANGIDGLISTFLGLRELGTSHWSLLGDLSALYDLSGLWPLHGDGAHGDVNLVIINNGGGRIFNRLFKTPLFENQHQLNFEKWAAMWAWQYDRVEGPRSLPVSYHPRVIEVVPDQTQSAAFWRIWEGK